MAAKKSVTVPEPDYRTGVRMSAAEKTRLEFVRGMLTTTSKTGPANINDAIRYCINATYENES